MAERGLRPGRRRDVDRRAPAAARSGRSRWCCAPAMTSAASCWPASTPTAGSPSTASRPARRTPTAGGRSCRPGPPRPGSPTATWTQADAARVPAGRAGRAGRDRGGGGVPGVRRRRLRQRHRARRGRRTDGDDLMSGFDLAGFLGGLTDTVRPGTARPLVVHADELDPLPADQVHNPTELAIAGQPADHDVRDLPPADPGRAELGHAAALPRDGPRVFCRRPATARSRTRRSRGPPATSSTPRPGRGTGTTTTPPTSRSSS